MNEGRALREGDDLIEQLAGLLGVASRPVDAGEIRREIHRHAIAEVDQIGFAGGQRDRHRLVQGPGKHLGLVVAKEIATKDPELQHPPFAMLFAVQGEQTPGP